MGSARVVLILSTKSAGSTALARYLASAPEASLVTWTEHFELETLFWTKAASVLGLPQHRMVDSEVPIPPDAARAALDRFLRENGVPPLRTPLDENAVHEAWEALVERHGPVLIEKSPHHAAQRSALRLIENSLQRARVDTRLVAVTRDPRDTILSSWTRFGMEPSQVEDEWSITNQNLLDLADRIGSRLLTVRYEELARDRSTQAAVLDHCGLSTADDRLWRTSSIESHRRNTVFAHVLRPETLLLAQRLGHTVGESAPNWPQRIRWGIARRLPHLVLRVWRRARRLLRRS